MPDEPTPTPPLPPEPDALPTCRRVGWPAGIGGGSLSPGWTYKTTIGTWVLRCPRGCSPWLHLPDTGVRNLRNAPISITTPFYCGTCATWWTVDDAVFLSHAASEVRVADDT